MMSTVLTAGSKKIRASEPVNCSPELDIFNQAMQSFSNKELASEGAKSPGW